MVWRSIRRCKRERKKERNKERNVTFESKRSRLLTNRILYDYYYSDSSNAVSRSSARGALARNRLRGVQKYKKVTRANESGGMTATAEGCP